MQKYMFRTIIRLKDGISDELLAKLTEIIEGAFHNRCGDLENINTNPTEFIFESDDPNTACLDIGMNNLIDINNFISCVLSWDWIDEEVPAESCNMLEVISRHSV